MKSCLGVIMLSLLLATVVGVGGAIYYLSCTVEFSRADQAAEVSRKPEGP